MKDHLDKETSVSFALTETGVKAKAQSRFVAAVDRFGGNLVELVNAPMERRISRQRAIAEEEVKFVQAVGKYGIERLGLDPDFAERSAEHYLRRTFEKQANKDAVLFEALQDLRQEPPSDFSSASGATDIDAQVLDRIEHYSEGATTEQLRQKWGRVLSAEVRSPGTFSPKVLRVVDELDKQTAELFEQTMRNGIDGVVPLCLSGELIFATANQLVMAGLLVEPGLSGHHRKFHSVQPRPGEDYWMIYLGDDALAFSSSAKLVVSDAFEIFATGPVQMIDGEPRMPVYVMTDAGKAIAKIFPKNDAIERYATLLSASLSGTEVLRLRSDHAGGWLVNHKTTWPPTSSNLGH